MFWVPKHIPALLAQRDICTRPEFRGTAETKEFICNQNSLHEDGDLWTFLKAEGLAAII